MELEANNATHEEDRQQLIGVEEDRDALRMEVVALSERADAFRKDIEQFETTQECAEEKARAHLAMAAQEIDDFKAEAGKVQMELEANNATHEEDRQQLIGVEEDRDALRMEVVALSERADAFQKDIEQFETTQASAVSAGQRASGLEVELEHLRAAGEEKVSELAGELQWLTSAKLEDSARSEETRCLLESSLADARHAEGRVLQSSQEVAELTKESHQLRVGLQESKARDVVAEERVSELSGELEQLQSATLVQSRLWDETRCQLECSLADARQTEATFLDSSREVIELTKQLEELRAGKHEKEERAVAAEERACTLAKEVERLRAASAGIWEEATRVAAEAEKSQLAKDLEVKVDELQSRDEHMAAAEQRSQELKVTVDDLRRQLSESKELGSERERLRHELERQVAARDATLAASKAEISQLRANALVAEEELRRLRDEAQRSPERGAQVAALEAGLELARESATLTDNQLAAERQRSSALHAQVASLEAQLAAATQANSGRGRAGEGKEEVWQHDAIAGRVADLEARLASMERDRDAAEKRAATAERALAEELSRSRELEVIPLLDGQEDSDNSPAALRSKVRELESQLRKSEVSSAALQDASARATERLQAQALKERELEQRLAQAGGVSGSAAFGVGLLMRGVDGVNNIIAASTGRCLRRQPGDEPPSPRGSPEF